MARPHPNPVLTTQNFRCGTTGKAAYVSKNRALRIVERSQSEGFTEEHHSEPAQSVYKCRHCGFWHLTKRKDKR